MYNIYMEISDIELISSARDGNSEALGILLARYKNLVNRISRSYFLAGHENDDLIQEGMIGLYKAYQSYKPGNDFKNFATLCIKRQIQTAVKNANRLKNKLLTDSIQMNNQGGIKIRNHEDTDYDNDLILIIPSNNQNPEDKLISLERVQEIKKQINEVLSPFEISVMNRYLKGMSYDDISDSLNKPVKSIDNALSRIKTKLSFLKAEKE